MSGSFVERGVLERVLGDRGRELPPEVARFFLDLSLNDADSECIDVLSEKANEGTLTSAEHEELATYVLLGDFLSILQSRARLAMKNRSPAA